MTANSSQLEWIKYVYVCLSKQYITSTSKNISIKQHIEQQKNISMDRISIISLFLLGSIWLTICYCLNGFLCTYKILQLTEQNMYVQVIYRNLKFCTYVLHKRHGQFFGTHSRIFFLNSVGDTMFSNYAGKMHYIWSQTRYSFWAIYVSFNTSTLQCCAISKTVIAFLLGKHFCQYFRRHVIFYFKYFKC